MRKGLKLDHDALFMRLFFKSSSEVTDEVEIAWEPPLEPICNSSANCNDWSHSSCKSARDGKRRCLCTFCYRWDGAMLKCRKG